MDSIINFYNNLFVIELTVFGIIAASFLVFLQIVYSQFSFREVSIIVPKPWLVSYLCFSVLSLLLTATGSLILSFPYFNALLIEQPIIKTILLNGCFGFILLVAFFVSVFLFILYTYRNIRFIRPSQIAIIISRKIRIEQIIYYLLRKYGVPTPNDWQFIARYCMDIHQNNSKFVPSNTEVISRVEQYKLEYEKISKKILDAQDPLEPLHALMLKAMYNMDLATIDEVLKALKDISIKFIQENSSKINSKICGPFFELNRKYLEYIVGLLRLYLDISDKQQLESVKNKLLEFSEQIAILISTNNSIIELNVILSFWKETADAAINKTISTFGRVISLYSNLLDSAFDKDIGENNWIEEIFRHLGWLGERLISRIGIEDKPLMADHDYATAYDQLFSVLLSSGYKYCNKYTHSYPHLYFDALDVIFLRLISISGRNPSPSIKQNIFDCVSIYSSFAKAAIVAGNSKGAAIAVYKLNSSLEELLNNGIEESAEEVIGLLVDVGSTAFYYRDKTKITDFFHGQQIHQYIMDTLKNSPLKNKVEDSLREIYLRMDNGSYYVIEMARLLQTDLGLILDPNIGVPYSDSNSLKEE
ncbi:MAG: hypothetical protein PHO26_06895 [Dehalococcoidia bacterium]|nr:hypothetical protein [Dehalococcoidia bacterium]